MRQHCILCTSGYKFGFYLQHLNSTKDSVGVISELIVNPSYGNHAFRSTAQIIFTKDLQRLSNYLEDHIAALQAKPEHDSDTFMSYDCTFQLTAFSGEVCANQEGQFSIQCMVNVGKPEGGFSTYLGGEAVVSVADTYAFINCLRLFLNNLAAL